MSLVIADVIIENKFLFEVFTNVLNDNRGNFEKKNPFILVFVKKLKF